MKGAYHLRTDNSGMTLMEVLISLFIFTIIAFVIPVVFSIWNQPKSVTIPYEERILFTSQLQLDLRTSTVSWTNVNETILYFRRSSDNATVQYELYQDKIRRRVNNTGHEVFLQYVRKMKVYNKEYGIELNITSIDGREYWQIITHPNDVISGVRHE
ncbi:competence protein ComGF [Evansella vedderi]|uniref:Competence protein ComGF n=1 Tax=Evansella vedderi TaxID=38282 RepID=A0ABT9ZZK3_9BACI|nr:competence type IV pilus minor pilin ComGF [Evansella vedderi]MDQ0256284.1 competence protein ComGF [Evansella vedderi]